MVRLTDAAFSRWFNIRVSYLVNRISFGFHIKVVNSAYAGDIMDSIVGKDKGTFVARDPWLVFKITLAINCGAK